MAAARTDVHRPTALVTEDYEYAYCYDAHPHEGDRGAAMHLLNALIDEGWHFGQVHGGDTCDHCGARLRYVAVLKHHPTHTLIKVGETCLENRFELATTEFHRLRKAAELNRERTKLADRYTAWKAADPRNQEAIDFLVEAVEENDNHGYGGFYFDLLHKARRYGELSEKQVAAALKARDRDAAFAARKAAEAAERNPVVTGKAVEVTGEVVAVKMHENAYGSRLVMTVKDDRGFLVWGTVPRDLLGGGERLKGTHVSFTAAVEASDRDECFGFFKRPRKARKLATA